jgi:hypothetical protein
MHRIAIHHATPPAAACASACVRIGNGLNNNVRSIRRAGV